MTTAEQWRQAAIAHGLTVVDEPTCPDCDGSGVRDWDEWSHAIGDHIIAVGPCLCGGDYVPSCPMTGETFGRGRMAWVESEAYGRPVAASSLLTCEACGERPARPGSDCCAECLESAPTMRGAELESMGGAL